MKDLIKQLIKSKTVNIKKLIEFITTYLDDRKIKYSQEELKAIIELFQLDVFNLLSSIETACIFYDYPLQKLYDRKGELIMIWIAD